MSLTIRPLRDDEQEAAREIHRRAFNIAAEDAARFPVPPLEDRRAAEQDGKLVAVLRVHRFGQFFGGRVVPSVGIGGVAVAPEARGRGVAERLVCETLREMRGAGFVVSSLYPATVPVYRRCGYEYAGMRVRYRAAVRHVPRETDSAALVEAWGDEHLEEIVALYRHFAAETNGLIDRPDEWWAQRVLGEFGGHELHRILVREGAHVKGYAVYSQEPIRGEDWGFDLDFRDLVWSTHASAAALLAFAARHRSVAREMIWTGSATDPIANLLPEQDATHDFSFRTMTRLIDVPAAIESRGYASGLEAAVELRVIDEVLDWNDGGWRIEVAGGAAKVSPEQGARATVDVGALAAIWTGMLSARAARRLGRLAADDETVSAMDAVFAGPAPWILDWF